LKRKASGAWLFSARRCPNFQPNLSQFNVTAWQCWPAAPGRAAPAPAAWPILAGGMRSASACWRATARRRVRLVVVYQLGTTASCGQKNPVHQIFSHDSGSLQVAERGPRVYERRPPANKKPRQGGSRRRGRCARIYCKLGGITATPRPPHQWIDGRRICSRTYLTGWYCRKAAGRRGFALNSFAAHW
jgi:hypothetical protein